MKALKNVAALALAACMTFIPIYSLFGVNRTKHTVSLPNGGGEILPDLPTALPNLPENSTDTPIVLPDLPENSTDTPTEAPVVVPPVIETPSKPPENLQIYVTCTGNGVNLRSGAGTGYKTIASSEQGASYAVIEKTEGWYCVYYRGNKVYISATFTREYSLKKSENAMVERVLEEGYKLLGTPYLYGAARLHDGAGNFDRRFTDSVFDCSSLTQYVFYRGAKKLLGTTTREQVRQGKYVKRSDLQRGDCIYFTNAARYYNVGIERVGHVAIYLGNDYILHTSVDYARIEKLTSTRKGYYIESRRFL